MSGLDEFPKDPLKPVEVARHWRVSPDTVVRMCDANEIPGAYRVGRQWRIPKSAVVAYEQAAARHTEGAA